MERTIECPECGGEGKFLQADSICQPCQGTGQLNFDAMQRLFIEARRASLRRSDREREWKRIAKRKAGMWHWLIGNSCNPKCKSSKKSKDDTIKKQGQTIKEYRKIMDEAGIDLNEIRYPSQKRGSISNT